MKRIFIQNRSTRQFLRNSERWVDSPEQAKTFDSAIQAYDFAVQHRIPDVEIVFKSSSRIESVLQDLGRSRAGRGIQEVNSRGEDTGEPGFSA